MPKKPTAPAESSEPEEAQEPESLSAPAAATVPKPAETAVSAMPGATVPSETPSPPAASEPPKPKPEPEPAAAPAKSPQDVEYERTLQTCKQQQPKSGDQITLRFKNSREPVEGVLEQTTAGGVRVKVPAGVIEYPFRLLADEDRLIFFPEERARRLQHQKVEKGE
jgi:DNA polymerase-3 subunit gamma/tau